MVTTEKQPLTTQAEFDRRSAGFDRDLQRIHDDIAELRRGQAQLDRKIDTTARDLRQELSAKLATLNAKIDARIEAVCDRLDTKIEAICDRLDAKIEAICDRRDDKIDAIRNG